MELKNLAGEVSLFVIHDKLTGKLLYHGTPSNGHGSMYQLEVVFRHGDISCGSDLIHMAMVIVVLIWLSDTHGKGDVRYHVEVSLGFVYPNSGAKTSPERRAETKVAMNSADESIFQLYRTRR